MTNRQQDLLLLSSYLIMQGLILFIFAIYVAFNPAVLEDTALQNSAGSIISVIIGLLFSVGLPLFIKNHLRENWVAFKKNHILYGFYISGIFFGLLFLNVFVGILFELIKFTSPAQNQAALEQLAEGPIYVKVMLVILTIIVAPITEELIFRKGLFGVVEAIQEKWFTFSHKYTKYIIPSLTSGLLFGAIHVLGDHPLQILPYLLSGLILSVFYVLSEKNLYVVMIGHAVFNLFGVLPLILYS